MVLADLSFCPVLAHAWGGEGHRIICAIAWDEMTPAVRAKALAILAVDTKEAFAPARTTFTFFRRKFRLAFLCEETL
jgi:hypothetical protein